MKRKYRIEPMQNAQCKSCKRLMPIKHVGPDGICDSCFLNLDDNDPQKDEAGKLDWTLIPFSSLDGVIKVREGGIRKYGSRTGWQFTKNGKEKYFKAALRHVIDMATEGIDHINEKDFGLPTIDHAICDLLFVRWFMMCEQDEEQCVCTDHD